MKTIVLSPETLDRREPAAMESFFEAGLRRYHVRKPGLPVAALETWLRSLPRAWRPYLVLHTHHELVHRLELGGCHYREADLASEVPAFGCCRRSSRSCHDVPSLGAALGRWRCVLLSPVFPSLSKPGYGPAASLQSAELPALLLSVTERRRSTEVYALGGVTPERLERCRELGFDGVALLGGIWLAEDPAAAFGRYVGGKVSCAD